MISIGIDIKKPHFVSEVRIFRQYDWMNNVIRQVIYTLCSDTAKIIINYNKTIVIPKKAINKDK